MRKLTTTEEVNALRKKKAIEVFNNFNQILNHYPDDCTYVESVDKDAMALENRMIFKTDYFLNGECDIYDLGCGYYMFRDKQSFHKSVNEWLVKCGIEKKLPDFCRTTSIFKIID